MARSWQEDFFEKLVEASHAAGDSRLASATLHRRKKTASYNHPQVQWLECLFDCNRISGNQDSQVLVVECSPRRATEVEGPALRKEFAAAGVSGDSQVNGGVVFAQYRWGFGRETPFPVHEPRRVHEAVGWTLSVLKLLFDHLERRQRVITAVPTGPTEDAGMDYSLALEKYLEDMIVEQWEGLPLTANLEYLGRQVPAGELGSIDILARDRVTRDFVVIELKRDQTDDEVIGQLARYMGWAKEHRAIPAKVSVRGIIVVHEVSLKLRAAASILDNVELFVYRLAVDLQPVSLTGQKKAE